ESYQQFIDEGISAQKVMDQLLAGGTGAIDTFDAANQSLRDAAQGIGEAASATLKNADGITYDEAVSRAQQFLDGLTNGLTSEEAKNQIAAAMTKVAKKMMKALKKELDIKSPSRKAAEVASFFVKGMVNQMY